MSAALVTLLTAVIGSLGVVGAALLSNNRQQSATAVAAAEAQRAQAEATRAQHQAHDGEVLFQHMVAELTRLRRENDALRRENDALRAPVSLEHPRRPSNGDNPS